ncbi:MAG: MerR family transcriptional regulator [Deltaproteobacteria bacterium]|nr:MerR family transcriptional regulator [Deltaproteobacteria bacterium]
MQPTGTPIPQKRYFRIGEVSAITGIESYVLRYWETEFPRIKPARSRSGQRLYKKNDIEIILAIKDLLYQKKFTIAGAKRYLQQKHNEPHLPADDNLSATLEQVRAELLTIREILSK